MALTEDTNTEEQKQDDVFALDKVLRNLNLCRDLVIGGKSIEERKAALAEIDLTDGFLINGSDYNPAGKQLFEVTSETALSEGGQYLDDKIRFWTHKQYDHSEGKEHSEHHIISMRYKLSANDNGNGVPSATPEQVWVNGYKLFDAQESDPTAPKALRLINRVTELSQQVKEMLLEREPVRNFAKILNGSAKGKNFLAEIQGDAPFLEGLKQDGGFEHTYMPHLLDIIQEDGETIKLNCKNAADLKAKHGFHVNTVDKGRALKDQWEKSAVHQESGTRFTVRNDYKFDEETGRHTFSLNSFPEDVPEDRPMPPSYELVRLEYEYNEDGLFELKDWNFMDGNKDKFKSLSKQHDLVGFYQSCLNYLNKGKYPPIHDLAHENNLDDAVSEFHTPPSLEEGIECLWIPFNGRNLEKQAGPGGDSLGGGNAFMSRYKKDDGTWSECGVIIDLPFQPWGKDGDWEGIQPDFKAVWDKCDTILLTHDHFDHATLEYFAYQGLLKGKKIVCDPAVEDVVRARLGKLGVDKEDYPLFVNADDPDSGFKKLDDNRYAFDIKDEDGNVRFMNQLIRKCSEHSAAVDGFMLTPTVNGEQINETYYNYGDAYELAKAGEIAALEGQLALLTRDDLSDDVKERIIGTVPDKKEDVDYPAFDQTPLLQELSAKYPNKDFGKLYIVMHDPTNVTAAGHTPRPEEGKATWRECMKMVGNDLLFHVPFSTSSAEIRAMDEIISEKGTLRNSTEIGANMELRGQVMNKHGAHPDLDLRTTRIPADKHPQVAFDVTLEAIAEFQSKRKEDAAETATKRKDGKTAKQILAEDSVYQVLSVIEKKAKADIKKGNFKPVILHDCFMDRADESDEIWEDLFKKCGSNAPLDLSDLKKIPSKLFAEERKAIKEQIIADLQDTELKHQPDNLEKVVDYWANSNVDYWCLKSLANDGEIQFDQQKKCSRNDYRMYQALMNDQEQASIHHARTSNIAKFFRNFQENLLIRMTGPIGSAEEASASLYRYAHGESLLDYDEFVRNTGYEIDHDAPKTIFVTQTPSMGRAAQLAQDNLMKLIVKNRNDTVFCAYKNGFKIHNPKEKLGSMLASMKEQGWKAEWDAKNNEIRVHDQPFHLHGHGFREDLRNIIQKSRAKLHTFVHIPGWSNLMAGRELVEQEGGLNDTAEPKDFVGNKAEINPETGELDHTITDYLTPSYWLIRLRRKFGQQYGGVVEMIQAIVTRNDGNNKLSGMQVRRSEKGNGLGTFDDAVARIAKDDFAHAANMDHSARSAQIGVSTANIRSSAPPKSPSRAEMLAAQLRQDKRDAANDIGEPS